MTDDNLYIENGCVLLPRNILQSKIWLKPPAYLKIFLYILLKVRHENGLFDRGENFFNFSDEKPHGIKKDQIYKFLHWARSENVKLVTTRKTTRGIVIKVNDYEYYQNLENYKRQDRKQQTSRIESEQSQNISNTINNNEIIKELEEETSKRKKFIPPSIEEVETYCLEKGYSVNAESFVNYYQTIGWMIGKNKIKDWKAAVRNWHSRSKENKPKKEDGYTYV